MAYHIVIEPDALHDLHNIIKFITTNDSRNKAITFANELKENILSLSEMPMRCRKSYYLDAESTRDLIYKGYTIVFQIRNENVHILSIFRQKSF
jgi:plasmid stabilization system protein ParE